MHWYLNKNVYLVKGKCGGCIYDFSNNEMFHISKDATDLIAKFPVMEETLSGEERRFLEILKQNELISDTPTAPTIMSKIEDSKNIDFVWIEVTTGCNLKCVHCYDEANCNQIEIMPYEDFCHIVDEIYNYGIRKIQLIGGEPLILKDKLRDFIDYCIGKFEYIEVFTNGTLLDESLTKYFKKNNVRVALSVYSYNDTDHDQVTGVVGSHNATNEAIGRLKQFDVSYRVRNVLMKGIELGEKNTDLYTLSNKRDVVRLTGRANINLLDEKLLEKKLITEKTFTGAVRWPVFLRNLRGHNCFSRRLYFSVDSTVYPCVMERRINHGNIRNKHLPDILNKELLGLNKDKIESCKECEYRYSCHDCRADSFGGKIKDKPWYCTFDPDTGVWMDKNDFMNKLLYS